MLNGLSSRTDWDQIRQRFPIGMVKIKDFYSHYESDVETPQDDRCLAEVDMGCIAHCFTIRGRHSLKRLRQTTINITIKEGGIFSKEIGN